MNVLLKNILRSCFYILIILLIGSVNPWIRVLEIRVVREGIGGMWTLKGLFLLKQLLLLLLGMIISFEFIFYRMKQSGRWVFEWSRFWLLVLPLIFISSFEILYYSNTLILRTITNILSYIGMNDSTLVIVQVLTGVLLISCLDRKKVN